jgi:hypothetical protein
MKLHLACLCKSVDAARAAPLLLKQRHIEEAALHQVALLRAIADKLDELDRRLGETDERSLNHAGTQEPAGADEMP